MTTSKCLMACQINGLIDYLSICLFNTIKTSFKNSAWFPSMQRLLLNASGKTIKILLWFYFTASYLRIAPLFISGIFNQRKFE